MGPRYWRRRRRGQGRRRTTGEAPAPPQPAGAAACAASQGPTCCGCWGRRPSPASLSGNSSCAGWQWSGTALAACLPSALLSPASLGSVRGRCVLYKGSRHSVTQSRYLHERREQGAWSACPPLFKEPGGRAGKRRARRTERAGRPGREGPAALSGRRAVARSVTQRSNVRERPGEQKGREAASARADRVQAVLGSSMLRQTLHLGISSLYAALVRNALKDHL